MRKKLLFFAVLLLVVIPILTLAACENEPKYYTITFDPSGGETPVLSVRTNGTDEIIMPVPTKEGYGFVGWYTENQVWHTLFTRKSMLEKPLTEDITLYARWSKNISKYTVSYDTVGGTAKPSESLAAIANAPQADKTGYVLSGWSLQSDSEEKIDFPYQLTENITLYAIWELAEYKVTYNTNGGTVKIGEDVITHEKVKYLGKFTPKTPSRTGYYFSGWYYENKLFFNNNAEYVDYDYTHDISINASWSAKQYTLTFQYENEEDNTTMTVTYGKEIVLPSPSGKEGYIFGGWYYGETLIENGKWGRDSGNLTLTAKWVPSGESDGFIFKLSADEKYYILSQYTGEEKSITIPIAYMELPVRIIGGYAFVESQITSVIIPEGITSMGEKAFHNSELVNAVLPDSLESLAVYAFSGCKKLTTITLGKNLKIINDYAFNDCESLTQITLPQSVKSIGWGAFSGCKSMKTLTLNNVIEEIKETAFNGCISLTSLHLPKSLQSLGQAFTGCDKLTIYSKNTLSEINSKVADEQWSADWKISAADTIRPVYYGIENIGEDSLFQYVVINNKASITRYLGEGGDITVPDTLGGYSVGAIGDRAFSYSNAESVSIPETLISINETAFEGTTISSEDITLR